LPPYPGRFSRRFIPLFFPLVALSGAAHAIDTATSVPVEAKGIIERAKLDVRLDKIQDEGLHYRQALKDRAKEAENALLEARRRLHDAQTREADAATPEARESAQREIAQHTAKENEALEAQSQVSAENRKYADALGNTPIYAGFANSGAKYYDWQGNNGSHGSQYLFPLNFYAGWQQWSFFIGGAAVSGGRGDHDYGGGAVHSIGDVYVGIGRRINISPSLYVDASLGVNLPAGRSALNRKQRYARTTGDLVEIDSFGGGTLQYLPGVSVTWRPTPYDRLTYGTSWNFSQWVDQTSDIHADDSKSGREWNSYLRYQHAEEQWQLVAEIFYTHYNRSRFENGGYYDTEPSWEYKLTYNRKIGSSQELMLYYWPERQNKSEGGLFTVANSARVDFYGLMWSKVWEGRHRLRVSFDRMRTDGSRFNGMRGVSAGYSEVMGRKKNTFGLGYDYSVSKNTDVSFDTRYFLMKDGISSSYSGLLEPKASYEGGSITILFNYNFSI
jgi:hypothetical protein